MIVITFTFRVEIFGAIVEPRWIVLEIVSSSAVIVVVGLAESTSRVIPCGVTLGI